MESDTSLEQANNEVMRKIGRNMLLFQQLEGLLKYIVSCNGSYSGTLASLKSSREKHVADIQGSTMGQLVGQFVESTYASDGTDAQDTADDEFQLKFGISIGCDEDYYLTKKATLAEIVSERNALIHHLLPKYIPSSLENLKQLDLELEVQREKLLPELNDLKTLAKHIKESRQYISAYLQTEEAKKLIVEGVMPDETRLEALLAKLASLNARDDGWASLSVVGRLLREQPSDQLDKALEELGISKIKSIKRFIEQSDRFELQEEPTKKGTQWLFRPKESAREVEVTLPGIMV